MKHFEIIKFQVGTLKRLGSAVIEAENVTEAEKEAYKQLKPKANEFCGAQAVELLKKKVA